MKMLWMSLLTLMMLRHISVASLPLRTLKLPTNPNDGLSEADQEFAEEYLLNFYDYQPRSGRQRRAADSSGDFMSNKYKEMQHFFSLPLTGKLDKDTLAVMKKSRCGLSDVEPLKHTIRWKNRALTYRITENKLPGQVSDIHKVFRRAWRVWSRVADLEFHRCKGEADVVISFNSRDHDDGTPFDGKGGTLAHAFLPAPGFGGDVHFDADEDWSLNSTGLDLFTVAVHEFGHALGLTHTSDPGAIMYPVHNHDPKGKAKLSFRDVEDIQRLYGVSPKYSPQKEPPKTPHKCDQNLTFDAVTELQQEIVLFKGRFMWRKHPQFTKTSISLINGLWPDAIPSNLDAVYENVEENFLVFFKGQQYWELVQSKAKEGFPRNISDFGFPSRIKSVDAALHFRSKRYTMFFTGHECWRYDEEKNMMVESPTPTEGELPGIEPPIDAAVFHEGLAHIFKKNLYFTYDFDRKRIVSVNSTSNFLECYMETEEGYAKKR